MIVVGVDAHSQTHTAAAVNGETGEQLGVREVAARSAGHEQLLGWARELGGARVWAIEDCRHLSSGLERLLLEAGERVLRVPPKLMASARKSVRSFGKSDAIDALAVASAALRCASLTAARTHGRPAPSASCGCSLITARTSSRKARAISAGCAGTCTRSTPTRQRPGAAPPRRATSTGSPQLARREQTAQVRICRELIRRIRELAKRVAELDRELGLLVKQQDNRLLEIPRLRHR